MMEEQAPPGELGDRITPLIDSAPPADPPMPPVPSY
jgi:hypothetical protein